MGSAADERTVADSFRQAASRSRAGTLSREDAAALLEMVAELADVLAENRERKAAQAMKVRLSSQGVRSGRSAGRAPRFLPDDLARIEAAVQSAITDDRQAGRHLTRREALRRIVKAHKESIHAKNREQFVRTLEKALAYHRKKTGAALRKKSSSARDRGPRKDRI